MVDNFLIYDLVFLVLFIIFVILFLYRGKNNIKREGLLILYRASWGMKLIDRIGGKYKKTLTVLGVVSVICGYILMLFGFYLVWTILKIYIFHPEIVRLIKVPPITPLIPYLPKIFKIDFLPPLYVTYWIAILAVAAIPHEFFHGIFMKRYGIKIKSTGFGFFPYFLPVFPAAFVEQDEQSMAHSSNYSQLVVLSAGTFANMLTLILFYFVMVIFFITSFTASGVVFDDYTYSAVPIASISMINGLVLTNPTYESINELKIESIYNNITVNGKNYIGVKGYVDESNILLYEESPAINSKLYGGILEIDGNKVTSFESYKEVINKYSPGDTISVITINDKKEETEHIIELGNDPNNDGKAWLGIEFYEVKGRNIFGTVTLMLSSFKKPHVLYMPKIDGFTIFIYNLILWILLASFGVAVVNMLPVGIFDGGRFFYITILVLTGKEKLARNLFSFMTYFFLFILFALMVLWAKSFF